MIKTSYVFTTMQPLHTGADHSLGIYKPIDRIPIVSRKNTPVLSLFENSERGEEMKIDAICLILAKFWAKIPNRARMTIKSEFASKIQIAANSKDIRTFVEQLCNRLQISEISKRNSDLGMSLVELLKLFPDSYDFLHIIRTQSQYIFAKFWELKTMQSEHFAAVPEMKKAKKEVEETGNDLEGETEVTQIINENIINAYEKSPYASIEKQLLPLFGQNPIELKDLNRIENVPNVKGNSIRGYLRRVMAKNFFEDLLGLEKNSISKTLYYQIANGGSIVGSGTGFEEIGKRLEYIKNVPMIGLFGTGMAGQTIRGALSVGAARLHCLENGNGDLSHHQLTTIVFGTRNDSVKLLNDNILIEEKEGSDKKAPQQMKFEYEVIIEGAEFTHEFRLASNDKELIQAYHALLYLFSQDAFICAKRSIGHGQIDTAIEYDIELANAYFNSIKERKTEIIAYLTEMGKLLDGENKEAKADKKAKGKKETGAVKEENTGLF